MTTDTAAQAPTTIELSTEAVPLPSSENSQDAPTEVTTLPRAESKVGSRDTRFTILKAIAIIAVVLSHAGISGWLSHFVFIFHVPIFFLCAGYFFHTKYLNDSVTFLKHRVRGLYLPFVRWSVFFLIIHNLLFSLGLLSEQYGNAEGGVMHPYNWHQWSQHLWSIVVNMSGYDNFLCGTFWFFRALFLASIGFFILFKFLRSSKHFTDNKEAGWALLLTGVVLTFWKVADGLTLSGVSQGGYRELMGMTLMAAGFLLRQYNIADRLSWKLALPCTLILLIASFLCPTSMTWGPTLYDFYSLPIPAVAAFVAFLYLSQLIDKRNHLLKRSLVHIGNNTLYIFAFHIVAFKAVSALKLAYYGLPWQSIGSHPTITQPASNVLWVGLYLLAGVGLPLLWMKGYRLMANPIRQGQNQLIEASFVVGNHIVSYLLLAGKLTLKGLVYLVMNFKQIIKAIGRNLIHFAKNIYRKTVNCIKDILEASSIKEE